MSNHHFPEFKSVQFNCVYCGVFARQEWYPLEFKVVSFGLPEVHSTRHLVCYCCHCNCFSYWDDSGVMIFPHEAPVPQPHSDMPDSVIGEYNEARSVFSKSPRAAVALLRLVVQKLMLELGEKGENINNDIGSLVSKGLPVEIQKALDICRVIGNNAVHPGQINLNDSPEIAESLFDMINFIIENRISQPRRIAELYEQLPESSRNAIQRRDA